MVFILFLINHMFVLFTVCQFLSNLQYFYGTINVILSLLFFPTSLLTISPRNTYPITNLKVWFKYSLIVSDTAQDQFACCRLSLLGYTVIQKNGSLKSRGEISPVQEEQRLKNNGFSISKKAHAWHTKMTDRKALVANKETIEYENLMQQVYWKKIFLLVCV